jgi:hypothetical protein
VNPNIAALLKEVGITPAARSPRSVTPDMVAGATRVVTFGCLDRGPVGAEGKSEDWPIPGATGKSFDELRGTRNELSKRIDDLITKHCAPVRTSGTEALRAELIRAAKARGTLTYGQLMKIMSVSRGRPVFDAIVAVDRGEYAKGAPGFAAIIVRKDTGFPGGGFFCDDDLPLPLRRPFERANDPRLSAAEFNYVKEAQRKIWDYYSSQTGP